jgi:glc operon protein GlcG
MHLLLPEISARSSVISVDGSSLLLRFVSACSDTRGAFILFGDGSYIRLPDPVGFTFVGWGPTSGTSCGARRARRMRARRKRRSASMLTLSKSRKIVDGAIQRARQLNAKISVAVCGREGRLIAFGRMDGCTGWDVDRSSMGKATAAAIIGYPSDQLCARYASGLQISSYANAVPPRGQRGGLPIVEEGAIEGGCGVSGAATAEESEECARAGIAALDFASTDLSAGRRAMAEAAGHRTEKRKAYGLILSTSS